MRRVHPGEATAPGFAARVAGLALEHARDGFLAVGPDGRIAVVTARAAELLGRDRAALVGRPLADLTPPGGVLSLERPWQHLREEVEVAFASGAESGVTTLRARVRPVLVDGVEVLTAFLRPLADAPRRFARELERRTELAAPARVVVLRVDNLHDLADALGDDEVEGILDVLAARLRLAVPGGAVARLAGDELAVVAALDGPEGAGELGRRLERVSAAVDVGGMLLAVEVSAGLAEHPEDGSTPAELLRRARRAAVAARGEGGGPLRWHAGLEAAGPPRAQIAAEFARALEGGRVVFAYQPQLDLASGRVVAAEALVRWRHPERGELAPGAFLPALERSPVMRRLALAALGDAVRQVAAWDAAGLELTASVNLSVLNLLDLGIAHDLARLLALHGVRPGRLTLEVTEDAIMLDPARAAGVLGGLRAMGVSLAVDDFGTGYSSLAYLHRLPVHELKIDRSFVRRVADDPRDAAIVGSIVDLARGLGLRAVAEGVETSEQERALRDAGCTTVQGFLVGRPMPAERVTALAGAPRRPGAADAR